MYLHDREDEDIMNPYKLLIITKSEGRVASSIAEYEDKRDAEEAIQCLIEADKMLFLERQSNMKIVVIKLYKG